MWVLRVGRKARWEMDRDASDPRQVAEAAEDLKLGPGESGLSVFRIDNHDEIREVGVRYALTCRRKPEHLDYVLFPEELVRELDLAVTPTFVPGLHPYLNDRHCEICGLTGDLRLRLAAAILSRKDRRVNRIREKDLVALGLEVCRRDPTLREHLKGDWPSKLSLVTDPASEGSG